MQESTDNAQNKRRNKWCIS